MDDICFPALPHAALDSAYLGHHFLQYSILFMRELLPALMPLSASAVSLMLMSAVAYSVCLELRSQWTTRLLHRLPCAGAQPAMVQ